MPYPSRRRRESIHKLPQTHQISQAVADTITPVPQNSMRIYQNHLNTPTATFQIAPESNDHIQHYYINFYMINRNKKIIIQLYRNISLLIMFKTTSSRKNIMIFKYNKKHKLSYKLIVLTKICWDQQVTL